MRQKNQVELNLSTGAEGEAPNAAAQETEARTAEACLERPAVAGPSMEAVVERENLKRALAQVKRNKGAPGTDGMTVEALGPYLKEHWLTIRAQLLEGTYKPQPVRRVEIPKASGGTRPLGIPTVLDRFIQQAVMQMLQADWNGTFSETSFGFRPGRSAHQAVEQAQAYIASGYAVVVDIDLEKFFDEISQQWLIRFLEHRIGDRRIIRLIQKWLKAGILEDGVVRGTGQGSVISPLLANIYLHYALDLWAARWRRRTATGDMIIVRYADDFIVGFQHESDAQRFLNEMRDRLREFALSLHPEKTRLIEFGRFAAERRGLGKPETFNFLGFTFICGKTCAGRFQIKRKTRADRMRAKLREIKQEMRWRMHQPIPAQGRWLEQVVRGYFNYHAVPTNGRALEVFRHHVTNLWRRTLRRRSQKDGMTWARMMQLVDAWLPKPIILHPWPSDRFAVTHPRWEPYAGKPPVRFCAGGAR